MFVRQSDDISLILGELISKVDRTISILQAIARIRPQNVDNVNQTEVGEDNDQQASSKRDKLRAMIDFNVPNDTLGPTGVSEANLIHYLGLIEHKANELLTLNFLVNSPKKAVQLTGDQDGIGLVASGVAGLLGQGPSAPVGNISIIAPSTA